MDKKWGNLILFRAKCVAMTFFWKHPRILGRLIKIIERLCLKFTCEKKAIKLTSTRQSRCTSVDLVQNQLGCRICFLEKKPVSHPGRKTCFVLFLGETHVCFLERKTHSFRADLGFFKRKSRFKVFDKIFKLANENFDCLGSYLGSSLCQEKTF